MKKSDILIEKVCGFIKDSTDAYGLKISVGEKINIVGAEIISIEVDDTVHLETKEGFIITLEPDCISPSPEYEEYEEDEEDE